jgi:hypothetical protein
MMRQTAHGALRAGKQKKHESNVGELGLSRPWQLLPELQHLQSGRATRRGMTYCGTVKTMVRPIVADCARVCMAANKEQPGPSR